MSENMAYLKGLQLQQTIKQPKQWTRQNNTKEIPQIYYYATL